MKTLFSLLLLLCTLAACSDNALPDVPSAPIAPTQEAPDAYHDKLRTQPFPKADNEIFINPTPLIVPQSMKTGPLLQFSLARSSQFKEDETLLSTPQTWCMFNPHRTLQVGTWHWRFRSLSADGQPQPWSQTYAFEVKEETPRFVTPAFDAFYQNAPRLHPRLYCFLDGRIEQARKNLSTHPEYKALLSRATTAAQINLAALGNPYNNIDQVKSHVQALHHAYTLTQQYAYSHPLHQLLRLLINTPVTDKDLFATNFFSTDVAYCLLKAYDALHPTLAPDEKRRTEEMLMRILLFYYPQQCGAEENHIFNNHFWQQNMRVLFQATFLLYDKPAYTAQVLPMMEYYYELWTARAPASGFNRDGVWHNGTGYFTNNVTTLCYMPMLFSYIARRDFLQHPWYQNAGRSLVYTWAPESKSAGFGDGSERGNIPNRQRVSFADFLARETSNSYAGWYAAQCTKTLQQDLDLRLYRMASPYPYPTDLPADAPKFVWYKDAGEVAMHSHLEDTEQDLALGFRSSTYGSGSHTVSNQNAFNLLFRGADVYRSTGYYLNFSDAHNLTSYRHTRAHNTILVDGIGQPYSTAAYGNVCRALGGKHITYCLGDASKAYSGITTDPMWLEAFQAAGIEQTPANGFGPTPLTKYRRHVLMLHPNTVLLYDELEASRPVQWQWLLHSPTRFYIDPAQQMASSTNVQKGFHAVAQLFGQHPLALTQTNQFITPPTPTPNAQYPNQWHLTATLEGSAATRILTVIQVRDANNQVNLVRRNGGTLQCGPWHIEVELDATQPARLGVSHDQSEARFDYKVDGVSQLYDEVHGEYSLMQQTDYRPASTRAMN